LIALCLPETHAMPPAFLLPANSECVTPNIADQKNPSKKAATAIAVLTIPELMCIIYLWRKRC